MDSLESPGSEQRTILGDSAEGCHRVGNSGDLKGLNEHLDGDDASMVSCRDTSSDATRDRSLVDESVLHERNDREGEHLLERGLPSPEDHAWKISAADWGEKLAFPASLSGDTVGFVNFGGGRLSDGEEEELRPTIADEGIQDLGPGKPTAYMENGCQGRDNNWGTRQIPKRETSSSHNSKSPLQACSSVHEAVQRLSDPLGMAVATVFYEVLERADFSGTDAAAVDELSRLLEAALKESLRHALGNDRGVFVENFRNAFRSTFRTRRSVSRAYVKYVKTASRLRRSRKVEPSQGKILQSEGIVETNERNHNEALTPGTGKRPKLGAGDGKTQTGRLKRRSSYSMWTAPEDDGEACDSTAGPAQDDHFDNCSRSSGKSCLEDSLKSCFFTDSNGDEPESGDSARSCSANFRNESTKSDSRHHVDGVDLESPLSQPTPDARDVRREQLGTEESEGDDAFFSSSSSEAEHLLSPGQGRTSEPMPQIRGDSVRSSTVRKLKRAGDDDSEPDRSHIDLTPSRKDGALSDSTSEGSSAGSGNCTPVSLPPGGVGISRAGDNGNTLAKDPEKQLGTWSRRSMKCETSGNGLSPGMSGVSGMGSHSFRGERAPGISGVSGIGSPSSRGERAPGMSGVSGIGSPSSRGERAPGMSGVSGMGSHSSRGERAELYEYNERTLVSRIPQQAEATRALMLPVGYASPIEANYALSSRYVSAMEELTRLKYLEIDQTEKRLAMKEDHLHLQSETNTLMKESTDVGRSRFELKEHELEDRKRTEAYQKLSETCADELVAGLCLMLFALAFSAWNFSYARLSRAVAICQLPPREPRPSGWFGMNWMANSMDSVAWHLKALTCEVTKAGRMVAGLVLIALVATGLFRRSVTTSSQLMPFTIIVVVLAGLCGFFGKVSIDSLGGDGFLWVSLWETLCLLHLVATSWTPLLHKYLYGPSVKALAPGKSIGLQFCSICARFSFHSCLVVCLPLMAGLLPFASVGELTAVFREFWEGVDL